MLGALEKERRAAPRSDTARSRSAASPSAVRAAQRVEPAAAHRLQDPEAEIVGEPDLRQVVALGQVVEREEVDGREVAKDVDDRAARVGVAHGASPRRRRPRCSRRIDRRSTRGAAFGSYDASGRSARRRRDPGHAARLHRPGRPAARSRRPSSQSRGDAGLRVGPREVEGLDLLARERHEDVGRGGRVRLRDREAELGVHAALRRCSGSSTRGRRDRRCRS